MSIKFFNFSKPSRELLLDLINKVVDKPFTATDLIFSKPQKTTVGGNTKILVTAGAGSGNISNDVVTYNRLDLAVLFNAINVVVPDQEWLTSDSILASINEEHALGLTDDDIVIEPIAWSPTRKYTLKADDDSLVWIGSVVVTKAGVDVPVVPYKNVLVGLASPALTIDNTRTLSLTRTTLNGDWYGYDDGTDSSIAPCGEITPSPYLPAGGKITRLVYRNYLSPTLVNTAELELILETEIYQRAPASISFNGNAFVASRANKSLGTAKITYTKALPGSLLELPKPVGDWQIPFTFSSELISIDTLNSLMQ